MKCGYVALVGKPNVGKSSILNAIFKQKKAIVTDKSQTTRNSINAIYNDSDSQIVFVDTPGIHKPQQTLGQMMNKSSFNALRGSDVAVLIFDGSKRFNLSDEYIFEHLKFDMPLIVVLNKIDQTKITLITKLREKILSVYSDAIIIETSALINFNIDDLINTIKKFLPESEKYYEDDIYKDDPFLIAEIVREKALLILDKEVPHSIFVKTIEYKEKSNQIAAVASIYVEKDTQKAIVIGKGGSMIKKIGIESRKEIEKEFNKHVILELSVKVKEDWRNNEKRLKQFGFNDK